MYNYLKSIIDTTLAVIGLFLFSPVFIIVAICIKLESPGPVFQDQYRIGLERRRFKNYKFRTMKVNYDLAKHQQYYAKLIRGELGKPFEKQELKMRNFPQITQVGRFLRKTAIDELPQIINVLRGDMSFIGPRAPLLYEMPKYVESGEEIFLCKPGIFSYWMAQKGSDISFDEMIKMDIEYVRQRSFMLDMKILLKAIGNITL